jgi:hypothetical protein
LALEYACLARHRTCYCQLVAPPREKKFSTARCSTKPLLPLTFYERRSTSRNSPRRARSAGTQRARLGSAISRGRQESRRGLVLDCSDNYVMQKGKRGTACDPCRRRCRLAILAALPLPILAAPPLLRCCVLAVSYPQGSCLARRILCCIISSPLLKVRISYMHSCCTNILPA